MQLPTGVTLAVTLACLSSPALGCDARTLPGIYECIQRCGARTAIPRIVETDVLTHYTLTNESGGSAFAYHPTFNLYELEIDPAPKWNATHAKIEYGGPGDGCLILFNNGTKWTQIAPAVRRKKFLRR